MSNATEKAVTYQEARTYLATLEARERARTGIRSLKVGWNEAQGYFIEITLAAISRRMVEDAEWTIPADYRPIANPANAYRFRTKELGSNEVIVMAGES
ncbi:MAG: hypothetical protein ACR2OE_15000 [Thermomicrobiales bacterium]